MSKATPEGKEEKEVKYIMREEKYWKDTPQEILKKFNQNIDKGFTTEQAEALTKEHGHNELDEEEKESIFEKIMEQFGDNLVRILLFAAFISFVIALTEEHQGIAAYIEPLVILIILILNAAIGIIQDIKADNAIEALKKMQNCDCFVRRNGEIVKMHSKHLVPGDIVQLNEGEKVPADIRLLDILTSTFQAEQSSMTGESEPSHKSIDPINKDKIEIAQLHNCLFSSTGVSCGNAFGIVIYTGMKTELGNIQKLVQEGKDNEEKSPLKKKIEEFGDYLSYIILVICVVVWGINYNNFFDSVHGSWINGCIYYFKISVALAVAAIPEGLPAVITTCLALGSSRLSKQNAIIRKLHSIETLGCTSVICSDKTGTLTTNNMTVTKVLTFSNPKKFSESDIYMVDGTSFNPKGEIQKMDKKKFALLAKQSECASVNNFSRIKYEEGKFGIIGTPTEGALRVFVEKCGEYDPNYQALVGNDLQKYNTFILNNFDIKYTLDFDRKRKAKSVIAVDKRTGKAVLLIKGAVEMLIKKASTISSLEGEGILSDSSKAELTELISENFMKKSLRTLALCMKTNLPELQGVDLNNKKELNNLFKDYEKVLEIENNCTLLSVVGLIDPPRAEVKDSIAICHKAGIRVFMITGDERDTAKSIGVNIGLIDEETKNESTFYAIDFFKLSENEKLDILRTRPKLVFARSEPEHKQKLILLLKKLNFVVAMTGDGTNDAPALANSDIGIAMGISGTEVAKEASHMVLADDNFATIVKAVEEGRSIYMNMKAFIRYLISSNIGEVVSIFISTVFGLPEAFTSIQLLWVNLVTDGPPATALSFNPTEKNIMSKPPRGK